MNPKFSSSDDVGRIAREGDGKTQDTREVERGRRS
jgi:hypothetical protein